MVKICPNCGKENKDTSKFCENCGQKFGEMNNNSKNTGENNTYNTTTNKRPTQFCKYCGEKIDAEAEICPKCGVRLKNPVSKKSPAIAYFYHYFTSHYINHSGI